MDSREGAVGCRLIIKWGTPGRASHEAEKIHYFGRFPSLLIHIAGKSPPGGIPMPTSMRGTHFVPVKFSGSVDFCNMSVLLPIR